MLNLLKKVNPLNESSATCGEIRDYRSDLSEATYKIQSGIDDGNDSSLFKQTPPLISKMRLGLAEKGLEFIVRISS